MKKAFIITVSILSCVILVMGIYLFTTANSLTATSASLENLYQRSLYELVNNVNNMEVEVSKLLVSNDSTSQQKILSNLKQQTSDAEGSLSLLPVNAQTLSKATKFMNQLNGYCSSLITYKDGTIEGEDYDTLGQIHQSIISIKNEINSIMQKVMQGYRIMDNIGSGEDDSDFSINFAGFFNDSIEYPSLIYDGPFSDSTTNKTIKGLPETTIDQAEAESKIQQIFSDKISNLTFIGETSGKFETYDFGVNTQDKNYFVQITKRGGMLLTMSANVNDVVEADATSEQSNGDSVNMDTINEENELVNTAIATAEKFAQNQGIENMKCVWSAYSENIIYVNLAPIEDEITIYPDLIKVKVELNSGEIVGYEATAYAYNHTEREDLIAQISADEAKKLVSENLIIDSTKLCVIPLDYVGETLAYEFSGNYGSYKYYLYIDAYTGNQVRVLRVVQTEQGELVM